MNRHKRRKKDEKRPDRARLADFDAPQAEDSGHGVGVQPDGGAIESLAMPWRWDLARLNPSGQAAALPGAADSRS